jgi:hypothetical protein
MQKIGIGWVSRPSSISLRPEQLDRREGLLATVDIPSLESFHAIVRLAGSNLVRVSAFLASGARQNSNPNDKSSTTTGFRT